MTDLRHTKVISDSGVAIGMVNGDVQFAVDNSRAEKPIWIGLPRKRHGQIIKRAISKQIKFPTNGVSRIGVTGAGGCGKTALIQDYCYRLERSGVTAVIWLRGDDLAGRLSDVAHELGLLIGTESATEIAAGISRWLSARYGTWILVVDDITDIDVVDELIPMICRAGTSGQAVVIDRLRSTLEDLTVDEVIEIPPLGRREIAQLLAHMGTKVPNKVTASEKGLVNPLELNLETSVAPRKHDTDPTYPGTRAEQYLALAQASSFRIPPSSVDLVERLSLVAGGARASLLKPQPHQDNFKNQLEELIGAGLVVVLDDTGDPAEWILELPRPVQKNARAGWSAAQYARRSEELLAAIRDQLAANTHALQPIKRWQIASDARNILFGILDLKILNDSLAQTAISITLEVAWQLVKDSFDPIGAKRLLERVEGLKPCPESLTLEIEDLRIELLRLVRTTEGLAERQQVSIDRRDKIGPVEISAASARLRLAEILCDLGRPEESEQVLRRLLEIQATWDEAEVLRTLHYLGYAFGLQTGWLLCSIILSDCLERRRITLGDEHPDTVTTRYNYAFALMRLGRLEEAQSELEKVVVRRVALYGALSAATLVARGSLANCLGETGAVDDAVAAFSKLVEDFAITLGPTHERTYRTRYYYASWLGKSGSPNARKERNALLEDIRDSSSQDDPLYQLVADLA